MNHLSRCLLAAWLAGGLFQAASAQLVVPEGASMDLGGGTLSLACQPMDISGSYNLSGGTVSEASSLQVDPGGSLNVQGRLEVGGDFSNAGQVNASAGSVILDGSCLPANATIKISGTGTIANLTINSSSGQTFEIQPGANITVTQQLTVTGEPGKPVQLTSANGQATSIQVAPAAQVSQSNVETNNVVIGAPVTPPITPPVTASAMPVPTLGNSMLTLLSLLVLALSLGTLRRSKPSSLFRKQHP